jgi:hypothetical protein
MNHPEDDRYEELMRQMAEEYPPPPDPRTELMWRVIEARAFAPRARRWWTGPLALAATLIVGIGVGYFAGRRGTDSLPSRPVAAGQPAQFAIRESPFVGVATNYLEQTTSLLIAVGGDLQSGQVPGGTVTRARDLLSTTRLLLDSGIDDPRLRELLEDLELVLAQVARLQQNADAPDGALITQALNERDVLPRLTYYLADNTVAP